MNETLMLLKVRLVVPQHALTKKNALLQHFEPLHVSVYHHAVRRLARSISVHKAVGWNRVLH